MIDENNMQEGLKQPCKISPVFAILQTFKIKAGR